MTNPKQSRSIRVLSHNIKDSLSDLTDRVERSGTGQLLIQRDILEDISDRFLLWAGNLGALQNSASLLSLDSRLSTAPEIREQTCELLDDLQEAIHDLTEIVDGNQPNRELQNPETDDFKIYFDYEPNNFSSFERSYPDEAHVIIDVISQCMRSLFRIGVLIRKASPRDRFQQALQRTDCVFPISFDLEHARYKYPKLRGPSSKFLSERMGNANAKRRLFIKYCREHQTRLEGDNEETEKQSSKATTLPSIGLPDLGELERNAVEEEDRISLVTASTTFESTDIHQLPTLRQLSPDSEPFECPICFSIQAFGGEKAWRFHAFYDLRAYNCTVQGGECDGKLFTNRNAWFEHELKVHRSSYACPLCGGYEATESAMISHIESIHKKTNPEQIQIWAERGRVVPDQFDARECPYCDEWAAQLESKNLDKESKQSATEESKIMVSRSRFKRHVATHQEQFATFVVPTSEQLSEALSGSESDDDSVQRKNEHASNDNPPEASSIPYRHRASPGRPGPAWRWNCCSCTNGGNLSYIYNATCTECGHIRTVSCCEIYIST